MEVTKKDIKRVILTVDVEEDIRDLEEKIIEDPNNKKLRNKLKELKELLIKLQELEQQSLESEEDVGIESEKPKGILSRLFGRKKRSPIEEIEGNKDLENTAKHSTEFHSRIGGSSVFSWTKRNINKIRSISKNKMIEDLEKEDIDDKWNIMGYSIEQEQKLTNTLNEFLEEVLSELYERANHFGLDSTVIDKIKVQLRNSLRRDINETGTEMQKLKIKIIDTVNSSKMEKTEILNLIETCLSSQGNFLDLLNRKLYGKTTPLEKELLYIMSIVDKKLTLGNYNLIRNEIEIHSLFNNSTLEELKGTIMHEFTHYALSVLTPKKIRVKRITNDLNNTINKEMPEMKQLDDKKSSEEKEREKIQRMFFNLLLSVDESLAYVAEKYYSKEKEKKPRFNAYHKKTAPELFQKIYNLIDTAANGKSLAEFDYFAAELYSNIVGMWSEDLTETQLKKIMTYIKLKIIDFQKGN